MDPIATLHGTHQDWLLSSVLAPHLEAFLKHLREGRYAADTVRGYLGCIAHLAHWMRQCHLPLERLDEAAVEQFLTGHLPRCNCPSPVVRTRTVLHAACGHLLQVLREQRAIAEPRAPTGPIAEELRGFEDYLRDGRGLADGTRSTRVRIVQRLLRRWLADRPLLVTMNAVSAAMSIITTAPPIWTRR